MKSPLSLVSALIFILLSSVAAAAGQEESDVRPQFVRRLQTLADTVDLFDPAAVSRALGIGFQLKSEDTTNPCQQSAELRRTTVLQAVPDATSWYRALPTGVRNMPIPAAFINPATTSGEDVSFTYKIEREHDCPESAVREDTHAIMVFGDVPAYACMSMADVRHYLPAAEDQMATDGVFSLVYQGYADDEGATELRFHFRMGAPCALTALVIKYRSSGWRFQRARLKHQRCEAQAKRAYCASHPAFTWADSDAVDKLIERLAKRCGSMADAYAKEPATGARPPPSDSSFDTNPVCDSPLGQ